MGGFEPRCFMIDELFIRAIPDGSRIRYGYSDSWHEARQRMIRSNSVHTALPQFQ